ncbi:hypothetical protein ABHI18_011852, partial [Aspergillus niger]
MPAAKRDVRGTVWFGGMRPPVVSTRHEPPSNASHRVPSDQTFSRATSGLSYPSPQQLTPNPAAREILARSPWEIYEPCAGIDAKPLTVSHITTNKPEAHSFAGDHCTILDPVHSSGGRRAIGVMTSALCSGSEHEDSWSTDSPCLSENTEDRDFIVSDSESLSEHGDELEEESEDYVPVGDMWHKRLRRSLSIW